MIYLGCAATSKMTCLGLMAKTIAVSQSTSGDVPASGLDFLNQDGDSMEVALARQLVNQALFDLLRLLRGPQLSFLV